MTTFSEMAQSALTDELQAHQHAAERAVRMRTAVSAIAALLARIEALPSAGDVERVGVSSSWMDDYDASVTLSLAKDKPSKLVRELAREFRLTLGKEKDYTGAALNASAMVDRIMLTVSGYVPDTCRIEEETVEVPAHTEVRRRIICDPDNEPIAAEIPF